MGGKKIGGVTNLYSVKFRPQGGGGGGSAEEEEDDDDDIDIEKRVKAGVRARYLLSIYTCGT